MNQASSLAEWLVSNGNTALEVVGTLAFALSGLLEAARKKLDLVGMAMVAALAAFGGGTLRDVILSRQPLFWIQNDFYIWVIMGMVLFAMLFLRGRHLELTERAIQWPDALGLGIFAAGGTQIALSSQVSPIVAVVLGVMTAVFGGILRDVFTNQIPRAFSDHQPYSVLAFAGGWVVVLLHELAVPSFLSVAIGSAVIILLRVLAMLLKWRLPSWRAQ